MSALQQERYGMGECIDCGDRLDDVSLAAGFARCGVCEPAAEDADEDAQAAYDALWPSLPEPWYAAEQGWGAA